MESFFNRLEIVIATLTTQVFFRDNVELPSLFNDNSYDFNYQETRRLSEEREILPGDSLQVVCNCRTKDIRHTMSVVSLFSESCLREPIGITHASTSDVVFKVPENRKKKKR